MKSWKEFSPEKPDLADAGKRMLLRTREHIGLAFLATIRKDGAPRLHPISVVFAMDRLFVIIPPNSPKCWDLKRDGRYALQAFPPPDHELGKEFYLTGVARLIQEPSIHQAIIDETGVNIEKSEVVFELLVEKAMYTILVDRGTPHEHPWHQIWPTTS